jgi:hypothetical protein
LFHTAKLLDLKERDSRYPDIKTSIKHEWNIERAENVHKNYFSAVIWHIFGFDLETEQNLIEIST